jgi:hypothetical protein
MKSNLLTVKEAAKLMKVSTHAIHSAIRAKTLKPAKEYERLYLIDPASLRGFVFRGKGRPKKNGK